MRRLPFNALKFHVIHRYTGVIEIEMHKLFITRVLFSNKGKQASADILKIYFKSADHALALSFRDYSLV